MQYSVAPPEVNADAQYYEKTCVLARDSFLSAKQQRAKGYQERTIVLTHVKILDTRTLSYSLPGYNVHISGGRITQVESKPSAVFPPEAIVIDCSGHVLMPGLCDAHVHCTAVTADLAGLMSLPESLVTAQASHILAGMLNRGFTTVRDAGGADWGLAQAVDEGLMLGPRILFVGHALSQTGGHGDYRGKGEDCCACGAALRGLARVCDGDAEVRRAARDELRKGAHCVKVMASGGVSSPTDRLSNTQFSLEELRAIVEEAQAAGTYVCAHAYMPAAIKRALACGVRSIEHGNWLDEECAQMLVDNGAFLVPTTITYAALQQDGVEAGMPAEQVAKVGAAVEKGLHALELAHRSGVTMCFGSDLLGKLHARQSEEFTLRASAGIPAADIIASATVNCAKLFMMEDQLGAIAAGYIADLILVDGDPLADISVLTQPERIKLVIKEGLIAKLPHEGLEEVNHQLFDLPEDDDSTDDEGVVQSGRIVVDSYKDETADLHQLIQSKLNVAAAQDDDDSD